MKKLAFMLALTTLSGCATTSPTQFYRAAGDAKQTSITGEFRPIDGLNGSISISINKEIVIDAGLPFSRDFELSGQYNENTVDAVCNKQSSGKLIYSISCLVMINNERAATLTF